MTLEQIVFGSCSPPSSWRRSDFEWPARLSAADVGASTPRRREESKVAHLLPVCLRGKEADSHDSDVSAYEVVTHPTTSAYLEAMGVILQHIVDKAPDKRGVTLRFNSVSIPDVPIDKYLQRIQRFFCCSEECFVLGMIYIDRLVQLHDGKVVLCSLNIHRILVTAVILAAKFFDDVYFSNAFYAKIGGLSSSEMNVLEAHFLNLIKYNLYVSPREYEAYRRDVTLLYVATHVSQAKSTDLHSTPAQPPPPAQPRHPPSHDTRPTTPTRPATTPAQPPTTTNEANRFVVTTTGI